MPNAIVFYRIGRWFFLHHVPLIPRIFDLIVFLVYNSKITSSCSIGKGTKCICKGISILIHYNAVIGQNCSIGAHCCILGKSPYKRVPRIGNNVFLGHNTVICGPVIIEDGAIIANGSIVTKSVPKNAIVAGVPAKIIGYRTNLEYDFTAPQHLKDDIMPFMKSPENRSYQS